ncbi:MAG: hypothetical protein FD167_4827 [bacterium]|nr:MAG: hypothetical protein FD167_4827 [bacterium]
MKRDGLVKGKSIKTLLSKLANHFGEDTLEITDPWHSDMSAIVLGNAKKRGKIVYIGTFGMLKDFYYLELELPTKDIAFPYNPDGKYNRVSYERLIEILISHLELDKPS